MPTHESGDRLDPYDQGSGLTFGTALPFGEQ